MASRAVSAAAAALNVCGYGKAAAGGCGAGGALVARLGQGRRAAASMNNASTMTGVVSRAAVSSCAASAGSDGALRAVLFPGDGIGPEIAAAVTRILDAAGANVSFEEHTIPHDKVDPRTGSFIRQESLDAVKRCNIGLKGPMATPIGKGHRSLNLTLRKELQLFANVRPCFSIPGYRTRYDNVDLVTVRENTEGEYSGLEHTVVPGVVESLKVITRPASMRVAEYAFDYAKRNGRSKVSAIHKANIMKLSDGLFLECCREVAKRYDTEIEYEEVIVDNCLMQLVMDPSRFDVLLMPNLYGDIVSDLCAGLIGGLGLTPSGNIGANGLALMEAVHGTAPDIAGKGLANPTALLLSSVMMLRHVGKEAAAEAIQRAVIKTIAEGKHRTGDLGGNSTTDQFTSEIIGNLEL